MTPQNASGEGGGELLALIASYEAEEGLPSDEEMSVSSRENPEVAPPLLRLAIGMAKHRGGGTIPVSHYDIQHARDLIAGEESENARLRAEVRRLQAELAALRAQAIPLNAKESAGE